MRTNRLKRNSDHANSAAQSHLILEQKSAMDTGLGALVRKALRRREEARKGGRRSRSNAHDGHSYGKECCVLESSRVDDISVGRWESPAGWRPADRPPLGDRPPNNDCWGPLGCV